MAKNDTLTDTRNREIVITRLLDAPRELVFRAWTDPKHLIKWWGPRGFSNTFKEVSVKTGGKWVFTMHGPDGTDFPNWIVFDEVVAPEKIVYSHGGGKEGEEEDAQFRAVITFEAEGNKTKLTMRSVFATVEERDHVVNKYGAIEGGMQTIDKLEEELAIIKSGKEFTLERELDAPSELVWKVWTEPEHLAKWWGPSGLEMQNAKMDLRPGGMFHYGMKTPDGHTMWGKFIFREIAKPERLIFIVSFSDEKGGTTRHPLSATWPLETLNTLIIEEKNGKTILSMRGVPYHASHEEIQTFNEHFHSMKQGFAGTFSQLEEYIKTLK